MKFIPVKVSSAVSTALAKTSAHSPKILFGIGVAGVVGTVILASRATLHLDDILNDHDVAINNINESGSLAGYTPEKQMKDKIGVFARTTVSTARLYMPAVVLGSVSIAALAGSHRILTTRNAALTAAYATLDKGFKEYRARVVEDLGEDKDRRYRYGVAETKVTEVDKDGKKKTVTKAHSTSGMDYMRDFREGNPNWKDRPELNILFLRGVQTMANDKLKAQGHLFLNDVYKMLGLEISAAGQVVGWVYEGPSGDGYVDFNLYRDDLRLHDYVITANGEFWLDFNVDGPVLELLTKRGDIREI